MAWVCAAQAEEYTLTGRIKIDAEGANGLPAGKTIVDLTVYDTVVVTGSNAQIWFNPSGVTLNCNIEVSGFGNGNEKTGKFRVDRFGNVINGKVTLMGDTVIGSGGSGSLTFSGQITGTGMMTYGIGNSSTITLANTSTTNVNNYTGDTVLGNADGHTGKPWGVTVVLGASEQIPNTGNLVMNAFTEGNGARGALNLNGFNESVNGLVSGSESTSPENAVIFNGSTTTASVLTLGVGDATGCVYSGKIGAGGTNLSVVKDGAGTQTLSGDLTYVGDTTVNGGILAIKPSGTFSSATTVNNSGRLNFEGTLEDLIVNVGGEFSPGMTTGAATVGNLTLNGDLVMEVLSATAFDTLSITGTPTFGDDSRIVIDLYRPTEVETLSLPMFNSDVENWILGENAYFWQNATFNNGTLNIEVNPNAIPEPTAWLLLIFGACGLWCVKKRPRVVL